MNLTEIEIQNALALLPENIRTAVNEFDWGNEVMAIAQKHKLPVDSLGIFHNETMGVILGLRPSGSYQNNLVQKMNISPSLASELVNDANVQIFSELQRRAFPTEQEVDEVSSSTNYGPVDRYEAETIEHEDLAGIMRNEGIELEEHPTFSELVDPRLQHEISSILDGDANQDPSKEDIPLEQMSGHSVASGIRTSSDARYLEPIEEKDLIGIKQREADTSILKRTTQTSPEAIFDSPVMTSQNLERDLGQNTNASLDQHMMNAEHTARPHEIDVSPSPIDLIKEDKRYLDHLGHVKL